MRHRKDHRKLSRTASHRKALLRNLVTALFLHERIETTVAKAKEARRLAERLITYAKRNNLHSRRLVAAVVNDRDVVKKVFEEIAPLYTARNGGYTRVLRTKRRLGDAGEVGILELVKSKEQKEKDRKRREEAAEAGQPKKKLGFGFGRKKSSDKAAPAAEAGTETATEEKKEKKEKKPRAAAPKKDRKPRAKDRGGIGGAHSPRKTRGSQRGK